MIAIHNRYKSLIITMSRIYHVIIIIIITIDTSHTIIIWLSIDFTHIY